MKTLPYGLAALLTGLAIIAGCGRHAGQGAPASATRPKGAEVASVAVKPESAPVASGERAGGMTEESESPQDVAAGMSPIAAAVAANTPAVASAIPSKWIDGKHYLTLVPAQPTTAAAGKVEVVEVFWYACGHCNHFEPPLEDWRKNGRAPYVEFVLVPAMFGDIHRAHARLYYTIEALGKLEQLHTDVFHEIHVNQNLLFAQDDPAETERLQRAYLKSKGVTDAQFDRTYRSFSVESKLQRAEQLMVRYKVTGVPMMVVNGKYTADVGSAEGEGQLLALVNDLAASEHRR
jgi:protein dithiol oxidoreductase (disulfide-forming)